MIKNISYIFFAATIFTTSPSLAMLNWGSSSNKSQEMNKIKPVKVTITDPLLSKIQEAAFMLPQQTSQTTTEYSDKKNKLKNKLKAVKDLEDDFIPVKGRTADWIMQFLGENNQKQKNQREKNKKEYFELQVQREKENGTEIKNAIEEIEDTLKKIKPHIEAMLQGSTVNNNQLKSLVAMLAKYNQTLFTEFVTRDEQKKKDNATFIEAYKYAPEDIAKDGEITPKVFVRYLTNAQVNSYVPSKEEPKSTS